MSISTYEFLSIVLAQRGNEPKVATNSADYMGVLESVRSSIALEHSHRPALRPAPEHGSVRWRIGCFPERPYSQQSWFPPSARFLSGLIR